MKKIFCLALAAIAAFHLAFGQAVSEAEARSLCAGFLQKNTYGISARAAAPIMETVTTARLKNGSPAYFVMQPAEGGGFVVLSANRAAAPVLGYSDTDSFDPQNLPPALQYLLGNYQAQLEIIAAQRPKPKAAIAAAWNKLTQTSAAKMMANAPVGPLLHTRWDQSPFYNDQCPQGAPTGCVATAMAQLMRYWRYPITDQTQWVVDEDDNEENGISGDFGAYLGGGYNWENMPDSLTLFSPSSQVDEIANLMYDCGVAAMMDYGIESSSNIDNAADAFHNYFGYEEPDIYEKDDFSNEDWLALLKSKINAGYPMYYRGEGLTVGSGHAWVCDGYHNDHFHMNWGWGQSSNAVANSYWTLNDLTPGSYNFNSEQKMFAPKPQGCTPFAVLSGLQVNLVVEVNQWISASSTLLLMLPTSFNAHDEIILTDGFSAPEGADFHALIYGCDGNFTDPVTEDRAQQEEQVESVANPDGVKIAPNPFTGSTTVIYSLSGEQQVSMQLLDATGKLVATPLIAQTQNAGEHQLSVEAGSLPAGVYFLVMQIGDKRDTKRLVLTN